MDLFIISQSVIPFAKKGILSEELEKKKIYMKHIIRSGYQKNTTCLRWRIYVCCLSVVHSSQVLATLLILYWNRRGTNHMDVVCQNRAAIEKFL